MWHSRSPSPRGGEERRERDPGYLGEKLQGKMRGQHYFHLRSMLAFSFLSRFFRRGWVTFDRSVNIKEICWNLQNIRVSAGRGTAEEEAVGLSMPRTTSDSGALGPFL